MKIEVTWEDPLYAGRGGGGDFGLAGQAPIKGKHRQCRTLLLEEVRVSQMVCGGKQGHTRGLLGEMEAPMPW